MTPTQHRFNLSVAIGALLLTTACYGSRPPNYRSIPLPDLEPGAQISVQSRTTTRMELVRKQSHTCPAGHAKGSPKCVVHYHNVREPVSRTRTTAHYGSTRISYGQFRVMTNPNLDSDVSRLNSWSTSCTRANIPRYAGIALLGLSLAMPAIVKGDSGRTLAGVTLAAGAGSYGVGYFVFGGRKCVAARRLYRRLDVTRQAKTNVVHGRLRARQMQQLADRFNVAHRARAAGDLSPPSTTEPKR